MSKLKNLIVKESSTWVEFPDIDGFEVCLRFLSREDMLKIRNKSLAFKFNKRTRQREEELDSAKFIENYADAAVESWRGLKVKHLPMLLPVDISSMDGDEEVEFSKDDAVELIKNSSVFDNFVTDSLSDFEQFSKQKQETDVKN